MASFNVDTDENRRVCYHINLWLSSGASRRITIVGWPTVVSAYRIDNRYIMSDLAMFIYICHSSHLPLVTVGCSDPILAYNAEDFINNLQWSSAQPDWVAIAFKRNLQILRV